MKDALQDSDDVAFEDAVKSIKGGDSVIAFRDPLQSSGGKFLGGIMDGCGSGKQCLRVRVHGVKGCTHTIGPAHQPMRCYAQAEPFKASQMLSEPCRAGWQKPPVGRRWI